MGTYFIALAYVTGSGPTRPHQDTGVTAVAGLYCLLATALPKAQAKRAYVLLFNFLQEAQLSPRDRAMHRVS